MYSVVGCEGIIMGIRTVLSVNAERMFASTCRAVHTERKRYCLDTVLRRLPLATKMGCAHIAYLYCWISIPFSILTTNKSHSANQSVVWFRALNFEISPFTACLHIPSPSPSLCLSPTKFNIMRMEMDRLRERLGLEPILSVKWSVTIHTM